MNKYSKYLVTIALVALAVTTFVLFELQNKILTTDPIVNSMLGRTIYQLSIGALFIWLIYIMGDRQYLFLNRTTKKKLLWCLPCLITISHGLESFRVMSPSPCLVILRCMPFLSSPPLLWKSLSLEGFC